MGTLELAVVGLAGSGVGTALGMPMVWPATRRPSNVRLMGGWLLALSLIVAIISARVLGLLPSIAAVNHAINLVGLAAYPLLYLYVREQTGRPLPSARAWWLWVPAGVYAAALAVRSLLAAGTKVPFSWVLPALLGFTALCVIAVVRRPAQRREGIVPVEAVVGFLVLLNVAQVIRMLFGQLPLVPALVPLVVTAGFIALVGLVVWRAIDLRPGGTPRGAAPRYEKSGLDPAAAAGLLVRIDSALSAGRLFAAADLTLGRLASAVDSTPHQVSEVLNRYAGVTLPELLSRHRVADVKAQLLDPSADGFTIEGIGLSAGFGSRSALYAAFRRLEGMTPTELRARRQSRQAPGGEPGAAVQSRGNSTRA